MHKAVPGLLEEPDITDSTSHNQKQVGNANKKEVGSTSGDIQLSIPRYLRLRPIILNMVQIIEENQDRAYPTQSVQLIRQKFRPESTQLGVRMISNHMILLKTYDSSILNKF